MRDTELHKQQAIEELQEVANSVALEYAYLGVHIEPDDAQEIAKSIIELSASSRNSINKVLKDYFVKIRESFGVKPKWKNRIKNLANSGFGKR